MDLAHTPSTIRQKIVWHRRRGNNELLRFLDELAPEDIDEVGGHASAKVQAPGTGENKVVRDSHRVVSRSVSRPLGLRHQQSLFKTIVCGKWRRERDWIAIQWWRASQGSSRPAPVSCDVTRRFYQMVVPTRPNNEGSPSCRYYRSPCAKTSHAHPSHYGQLKPAGIVSRVRSMDPLPHGDELPAP